MAQLPTGDPFGYVGCYVLRRPVRKGRRRPRSGNGNSMKPDPGAVAEEEAEAEEREGDGGGAMTLYGWVTRYDVRLDVYTLFEPGASSTALYARGEIMRFVSDPEFVVRKTPDAAYPPPMEDTRSRFVDAPVRKAVTRSHHRGAGQSTEGRVEGEMEGRVECFLPFMDTYCVAFDDGSKVEMSEREVVDALLLYAKRVKEKEKVVGCAEPLPHAAVAVVVTDTEHPKGRKRRRSEDFTPDANANDVEDDGEETEDEEPPAELLTNETMKSEAAAGSADVVSPAKVADNAVSKPPSHGAVDAEIAGVKMQVVSPSVWQQSPVSTGPAFAVTHETTTPPAPAAVEMAAEAVGVRGREDDDDAEEPIDIPTPEDDDMEEPVVIPSPDDDVEDEDVQEVTAAMASTTTSTATATRQPFEEVVEGYSATTPSLPLPLPLPRPVALTGPPPLSYIVNVTPHVPTTPLDKRSMAFEFVRTELTRLIESPECADLEIKLVADVLSNRDIKDRDAIRRFVETGGLVAVNQALNVRSSDALVSKAQRYDRVLFVLKLLAMLPTPSEKQVMESVIGKTIGRFIKSRLTDQQTQADKEMPRCIPQLAKWIKHKWVANMQRSEKPANAQGSRRGPVTQTNKFPSSTTSNAPTASKKQMQRPSHGRPPGQRANDPVPIPRLAPRTPSAPQQPPPPPPVPSFAAASGVAASSGSRGDAQTSRLPSTPARSSLKPDWIRQKEAQSRSRFTIGTDANAERQHYQQRIANQQRERANAIPHISAFGSATSSSGSSGPRPSPPLMENPGDRGVFGRSQRLSFGPRWNVCEFFKDAPPSAVRRVASTASSSTYNRNSSGAAAPPPRSILRRSSKYNEELRFGV